MNQKERKGLLEIFSGMSAMFVTAIFVVILFLLLTWGARFLRVWLESRIQADLDSRLTLLESRINALSVSSTSSDSISPISPINPISPIGQINPIGPISPIIPIQKDIFAGLNQASFTDLFSGVGWLDKVNTNFYQDRLETAFVFPPNIEWKRTGDLPPGGVPELSSSARTRCIEMNCLKVDGLALFFNGREIPLPSELQGKSLQNLSIASLDSRWILGAVVKDSGQYNGWVFIANPIGSMGPVESIGFQKIFGGDSNNPFTSKYKGTLGFGGSDGDWLAIYGGYEGIAYRIRPINPISPMGSIGPISPIDISRFFGIRVMDNGFEPAVIRAGDSWYVFSLTYGEPRFIKLFQNGTDEIQGAVDLVPLSAPLQNASGATFESYEVQLRSSGVLAKVLGGSGEGVWEVSDLGFKKDEEYQVVSSNLNLYKSEIHYARIEDVDLAAQGADVKFFFAGDDKVWHPVKPGELYKFPVPSDNFFWRAVFSPLGDNLISPHFDTISIYYWLGS